MKLDRIDVLLNITAHSIQVEEFTKMLLTDYRLSNGKLKIKTNLHNRLMSLNTSSMMFNREIAIEDDELLRTSDMISETIMDIVRLPRDKQVEVQKELSRLIELAKQ